MEVKNVKGKFESLFNTHPLLFKSPGRINLIGEHTDYNDGYVLPAAIDKEIIFAMAKNNNDLFRFYSYDLDEYFEIDISEVKISKTAWANYLLGVIAQFQKTNSTISGIDCVFGGDIPIGAGLSSSAAIECGFALGLNKLFNLNFNKMQLVKMAQNAEHEYAGVMCGIMDQFANMHGKQNHVLQLDCRSLEYKYFPLELNDYIIVLCDTQVKHSLASSEYNLRREECEKGVEIIKQEKVSVKSLRDLDYRTLKKYEDKMDSLIYKRCKYVVLENQRVIDACYSLVKKNMKEFGKLMFASHNGLRNEYEVSCDELDLLVQIAMDSNDVIGARMMGGGFGGCTINIVKKSCVDAFKEVVLKKYKEVFRLEPLFYKVSISEGTNHVNNSIK